MKPELLLAATLFLSPVAQADSMPEICKTVVNFTAQSLNVRTTEGSWADPYNPGSIRIRKDLRKFPITSEKFLGNCDEDSGLKESWCRVAGGSPNVYQAEVGQAEGNEAYPFATVIVTFNRGGCHVAEASLK